MGVRPSSVDSQHPASCRMCPYIGTPCDFLYTPSRCNFPPISGDNGIKLSLETPTFRLNVPLETSSDGRDRVSALRELPFLTLVEGEPALELASQRLRLYHRVDHQLGGQVKDVDVSRVLGALVPHEPLALLRI